MPPPRMRRDEIAVETVMRSRPRFGDLPRALRMLLEELERPGREAAALVALTSAEVVATVGLAVAGMLAVDDAVDGGDVSWALVGASAGLTAVAFVVARARKVRQEELIHRLRGRAVERLARSITAARYEDLAAVPMAALRELLMTDVDFAYRFFVDALTQAVVLAFWVVAAALVVGWLSPPVLALLAVIAAASAALLARGAARHMTLTGERFVRLADLSQQARGVVEVERVVLGRQLGVGEVFVGMFLAAHRAFVAVNLVQQRLAAALRASVLSLNGVAFVAVVLVGAGLIAADALTPGALVAILFVVGQLLGAVAQSSEYAYRAAETAKAGRRLAAYWWPDEDDHDDEAPPRPERIDAVRAVDVTYAYPGSPPVLERFDVEIERGRLAALTGATGSGKTTLALLLTGVLRPDRGTVTNNGDPTWPAGRTAPGRVLYVGARPALVAGSVLDNLLLPDPPPAAEVAALLASLAPTPERLPVDVPLVGPNGTGLSTGQAQLVGMLRAYYRRPEVVVFDEATSALDMDTEARVQEAMLDWVRARTTLVISHRECPWTRSADQHLRFGAAAAGAGDRSR